MPATWDDPLAPWDSPVATWDAQLAVWVAPPGGQPRIIALSDPRLRLVERPGQVCALSARIAWPWSPRLLAPLPPAIASAAGSPRLVVHPPLLRPVARAAPLL